MKGVANFQTNPERLRFVTQSLAGLQHFGLGGLGLAVFGAALATIQMSEVYLRGSGWVGMIILGCLALVVASILYLPRYYRWRFGWVEPRMAPVSQWIADLSFKQVWMAAAVLLFLWLLAHLLAHALPVSIDLMPLFTWLVALSVVLWFRHRIRKSQANRLIIVPLIVTGIAWITFYPLWHPLDLSQSLSWKTLNAGSLGFGCMVLGLHDHLMLVHLIPKRVAEDHHEG